MNVSRFLITQLLEGSLSVSTDSRSGFNVNPSSLSLVLLPACVRFIISFCSCAFFFLNRSVHSLSKIMVSKIQDWEISSWNCTYHLYKSVPLVKNGRKGLKQVSKMALKKWKLIIVQKNTTTTFSDGLLL